jgi:pimeloyl-ACP methyl ester carboxylesterase
MNEHQAVNVGPSGIQVAYELFGAATAPPVLLIMGAGAQMIGWPEGFCAELAGLGARVIRFDNRDSGHSTHFADAPPPDLPAALAGDFSTVPYTLSDMAADTVGLLDALGVDSAHVVGASLGGMIAQVIAIEHPGRVRSLTSMMSTTGARDVGQARPEAFAGLGAPPDDRAGFIDWQVRSLRAVGSPGFAFDEAAAADRAGRSWDRDRDRLGITRQAAAAVASGDRTGRLRSLQVPALVIHGGADVIFDVSGGRATAAAIPGAELMIVDGMGHSLPREVWPGIAARIMSLTRRADAAGLVARGGGSGPGGGA